MTELTTKQYRRLRDMADGHLTLYATVHYYDPQTGERLAQPDVLDVRCDRPDVYDADWWRQPLRDGLIALPTPGGSRFTVTAAGRDAVRSYTA